MLIPTSWLLLLRIILCPAFAWVNGKKPGIHHLHKHFVAGNNHVDRVQIFHHHLYYKMYIWMIICTCCYDAVVQIVQLGYISDTR